MKQLLTTFNNWPISRKLLTIVVATSGLLISMMTVAVSLEKYFSFRAKLVNNSTVLAEVIGANSTAALVYRDPETAYEILSALQAEQDVLTAALYDGEAQLFVSYINPSLPLGKGSARLAYNIETSSTDPVVRFSDQYFDVTRPIILKGEAVGHIILRTNLTQINHQLYSFWYLISGLSILLLAGGVLICSRLNKTIVGPVSQLAQTMQHVTKTQNYEAHVKKLHDDEIGILVDGFNIMLATIRNRELELEKHHHHLEELVNTRTQELQYANEQVLNEVKERQAIQAKLAHAEKMEAIGTLAGGVAHDLNNILSGIVTYPDLLLLNLPEDSELRAPIETIRTSGNKAAAIVHDLLTLARRGVKVEDHIDLQEVVHDYLNSPELKALLAHHPQVAISFNKSEEKFLMRGSPVHLGKTIMNLVANGVEAMNDGGKLQLELAHIFLDTQPPGFDHWREGTYICLTVSDTGVGIPAQDVERIFEPFYSRKVMGKSGTGLGMAVVWGSVEDHKGYITVSSKEGEGTTFQLFFPAENEINLQLAEAKEEKSFQGSGQSVLVVDDSGKQRQIASDILNHLGYAAHCVDSGEAAIDYLRTHTADLIILDMLMAPGIDGLETYKRILEFCPGQKAFIASGYSQPASVEEARVLGVSAYVMKPYTVRRLGEALRDAFANEQ